MYQKYTMKVFICTSKNVSKLFNESIQVYMDTTKLCLNSIPSYNVMKNILLQCLRV